jgi:hypothetical protein
LQTSFDFPHGQTASPGNGYPTVKENLAHVNLILIARKEMVASAAEQALDHKSTDRVPGRLRGHGD